MNTNIQHLYSIFDYLRSRFGRTAVALTLGIFLALGFHLAVASPVMAADEDETTTTVEETGENGTAPALETTDDGEEAAGSSVSSEIQDSLKRGVCLEFGEEGDCDVSEGSQKVGETINNILTIFSLAIGTASLVMILYGSFRYVVSGGDEKGVKSARSTIIYSVVGLVLALLAQAIIFFVLDRI